MKLGRIYLISIIIVLCAIIATIQAASAAPVMSVEPSDLSVAQGDTFTVNITVDPDGDEVMGAQYDLYFDNTLLHATDQTSEAFLSQDGVSTNVYANKINNTLGKIEYSETRITVDYGVTSPGVLATITFKVRCSGVSELSLGKVKMSYPDATYISGISVNNATVTIAQSQPSTPFLISGYVFHEDGSGCNDPTVNIANLNTSMEWTAEKDASSNYYQLSLSSCADVIAGDVLHFDATSSDGSQSSTTEHTVTQDEVGDGGISNLNITLSSSATPTPTLVEYTISNRTITPPQTTDIDVRFSEEVEWRIAIENGGVVQEWTQTSTNPNKRTWDGTYEENDTIVPDGAYIVNITWTSTTTDLGGQNKAETITVSTSPDTTSPVITNVANSTPTDSLVTITWDTDENSDGLVKYGTTSGTYTDSTPDTTMTTSHTVGLSGLTPDTKYYFVVNSTDASGNSAQSTEYSFTTATYIPPSTTVSIGDVTVAPGGIAVVPIMVNNVADLGGGEINITYDGSVVHVTNVTQGDMDLLECNINNGSGWMYANAINLTGLSEDVVFAYVNLTAVGSEGDTSPLNITVKDLFDVGYDKITHTVINGTFTIAEEDGESPLVTDASASRDTILNDNGRPRAPGTNVTVLNVTVTDGVSGVSSVTIDLSSIGGSEVQPMEQIPETDIWTVTTTATDGVNLTHQLTINATDNKGNHNNTVAIQLTVLRRGDVCRDNAIGCEDVMYIARYLAGLEPECSNPPNVLVGDVVGASGDPVGDGIVNLMDALYMARHVAGMEGEP